ncbi:MAG: hypothetical protein U0414_19610 [Polyangiaceae bacterium]
MTTPLSLRRFAELAAYTGEYPERDHDVILEKLGASREAWNAARAYWPRHIGAALEAGDADPLLDCAATLGRIRKAIRLWRWPIADIRPDEPAGAPAPARAAPLRQKQPLPPKAATPALPAAAAEVPSYLREGAPAPAEPAITAAPLAAGAIQIGGPSGPVGMAASAPEPRPGMSGTALISGPLPGVREAMSLPFKPGPAAAQVAPKPLSPPDDQRPEQISTGTAAPSATSPVSLPFLARKNAKEDTKLKPEQVDLSLFPLEIFAEISGGLARGEERTALLNSRGLTDALYDVLAQAWAQKLEGDPVLMSRFKELARQAVAGVKK